VKRVEAKLERAPDAAQFGEALDLEIILATEDPVPQALQPLQVVGEVLQEVDQRVANLGPDAEHRVIAFDRRRIDREKAVFEIEHLDDGVGAFDDVGQDRPLGEGLLHPLLERFVQLLQRLLRSLARRQVLEQHRDLLQFGRLDPEGGEFEMAAGGDQFLLEADRPAGA